MEQREPQPPVYLRAVPAPEPNGHSPAPAHHVPRWRRTLAWLLVVTAITCYGIFIERMWGPAAVFLYIGLVAMLTAAFLVPTRRRSR